MLVEAILEVARLGFVSRQRPQIKYQGVKDKDKWKETYASTSANCCPILENVRKVHN
jgi:hypothetical protein